jgi:acetyl/propionyl-CoA carboxylase alpha subunit
VDSGVREGQTITVHYDPLLAKLIAHGRTRGEARDAALAALRQFEVLGVRHNIGLLVALLGDPRISAGPAHTTFIEEALEELVADAPAETTIAAVAIAGVASEGPPEQASRVDPFDRVSTAGW